MDGGSCIVLVRPSFLLYYIYNFFTDVNSSFLYVSFSWLDLEMVEFVLHDLVVTAVSQVMLASQSKGVRIVYDLSDGFMNEGVFGDSLRLQQILAGFLLVSVKSSPSGGLVEIAASLIKDQLGKSLHVLHLELRYDRFNGL